MEAEKSVFVEGCKNNSITENKANEIFDNIEKFAGYGFNKSHLQPMLSLRTKQLT